MATTSASIILFVILIHGVLCATENETVVDHADPIETARQLVNNFLNDTENKFVPGLVIGVTVKGERKWLEGFGLANIENNVTMTGDAVMQIGSISKSFTVGLAARLVQEGKLDFDVPISKYLSVKDFPEKMWNGSVVNITLRHLFQMTAGIPNGPSELEVGKCLRCLNQTDHLIFMRDKELDFEPGSNFTYSNFGFELAAAVIESVLVNKTFDVAMTEMIKKVLKLNKTAIIDTKLITPHLASFYTTDMKSVFNSGMWGDIFLNDFHAAGGIMATMTDLLTYGQTWLDAYYGRREHFLKQFIAKNAWTPSDVSATDQQAYGMGWVIQNVTGSRPSGSKIVWHNGGTIGCRSILAIYPETEIIVAASVNLENCSVDEFILEGNVADIFANNHNKTQSEAQSRTEQ